MTGRKKVKKPKVKIAKTVETVITISGRSLVADLQKFGTAELKELQKIFKDWRKLNKRLLKFKTKKSGRTSNIPEVLTEGAFAYFKNSPRLHSLRWKKPKKVDKMVKVKGKKRKQKKLVNESGPSASWDCYDLKNKKRIQVKATSSKADAPSSFGPRSEQDKLYFLDFYQKGKVNGKFDVYDIPLPKLYKVIVNEKKKQTLEKQASMGLRPRTSIHKSLIKKYDLKPIETHDLMNP